MFFTPHKQVTATSPPQIANRVRFTYFNEKVRSLELPEMHPEEITAFENACYYATTTRDVSTMKVFFVEVTDVYADTIMYRIVPQALHCALDLNTAKERLQGASVNVARILMDASGTFFEAKDAKIYSSLVVKLG